MGMLNGEGVATECSCGYEVGGFSRWGGEVLGFSKREGAWWVDGKHFFDYIEQWVAFRCISPMD